MISGVAGAVFVLGVVFAHKHVGDPAKRWRFRPWPRRKRGRHARVAGADVWFPGRGRGGDLAWP